MDRAEAAALLASHLADFRQRSYAELRALVGVPPSTTEIASASGTRYQIEVEVFWDAAPEGLIRVRGEIDDGGWRAFVPLCSDFLLAPDGQFVGEAGPA